LLLGDLNNKKRQKIVSKTGLSNFLYKIEDVIRDTIRTPKEKIYPILAAKGLIPTHR